MQQNVYYASGGSHNFEEDSRQGGPASASTGGGVMGSVMGTFRAWSIASGGNQGHAAPSQSQAGSDIRGFEEMETAHNLRFAQMAQEKDATIEQLEYKLRLREEAIQQLEQNILMQQGATELIRKECESVEEQLRELKQQQNQNSGGDNTRRESGSHAQMEEDEMKEIIQQLHNKLREKSDTNNALLRTTKTQRDQIVSLEKTVAELRKEVAKAKEVAEEAAQAQASSNGDGKGNEAMEEKIEEMKEVIQQLHAKLLDKNNTNAALVRSAKMQNDKCAAFRSEIQALQAVANDTREQHQLDMERLEQELIVRNDEIASLRQQLSAKTMNSVTTDARSLTTHQNDIERMKGGTREKEHLSNSDGRETLNNAGRSEEDGSIATQSENSQSVGSRESERKAYGGASASGHERASSPLGEYSSSRYSERSVESDSRHQRGNQYSDDSSQDEFSSYNSEDDDVPANGNGGKGFNHGNGNHRSVPHADKYY